jgi:hypothetical protein
MVQWDACFAAASLKYAQGAIPGLQSPLSLLDLFYAVQHEDGAIPRAITADGRAIPNKFLIDDQRATPPERRHHGFTHPPLFSWAEWEYHSHTGDESRLRRVLPHLAGYFDWYTNNRLHPQGYLWCNEYGTAMPSVIREDAWGRIDYTAQAALDCEHLSNIACQADDMGIAGAASNNYLGFQDLVQARMWESYENHFCDVDQREELVGGLHIGAYWPLMAGIALPEQGAAMVAHLRNVRHFARPGGVPLIPASRTGYGLQPVVEGGCLYMVLRALRRVGQDELAQEIALRALGHLAEIHQDFGVLPAAWSAEEVAPFVTAPGLAATSLLLPIAGLIEEVLGIRVQATTDRIDWHLRLNEPHGIRNLLVGRASVDLAAEPQGSGWKVTAKATGGEVDLFLVGQRFNRTVSLKPGRAVEVLFK